MALKRILILTLLSLVPFLGTGRLRAQVAYAATTAFDEYLVKGSFLINFSKFVEWPPNVFPISQRVFTIGILGMNPFAGTLEDLARENQVQGRRVAVRRFMRHEDSADCQLLFISVSEKKHLPDILKVLKGKSILTVSDMKDFARSGGMIGLVIDNDRVLFEINEAAARKNKLKMGAQLLKLARRVITTK